MVDVIENGADVYLKATLYTSYNGAANLSSFSHMFANNGTLCKLTTLRGMHTYCYISVGDTGLI